MEEQRFKNLYNYLLKKGELTELLRSAKGEWELDKEKFIRMQRKMEENLEIDLD